MEPKKATVAGDLSGGLVGGLLALPEAMALGVLIFGILGDEFVAFGVVSGITSLAVANLCTAPIGSVRFLTVGDLDPGRSDVEFFPGVLDGGRSGSPSG